MAFTIYNWSEVSVSLNQGLVSAAIATPSSDTTTLQGAMNLFSYYSLDAVAVINAVDYFVPVVIDLELYDVIMVTGSDASEFLQVSAITKPDDNGNGASVTTESFTPTGSVGTANLVDLSVTTAKIADLAVTTGKIAANAVTSAKLDPLVLQYVAVPMTAAQFKAMYATPFVMIAAPGANKLIVVDRAVMAMTFVSADYAAGGVVGFQYDSTAHGAGAAATNTEAAADFFAAASTAFQFEGVSGNTVAISPFSTTVNKGLYLSNLTQAFTTGDSTWVVHIWYKIIPTV